MPLSPMLFCILALLLLQEAFPEALIESLTVVEGQDLDLHCVVAGDNVSALQWSNPCWFVIFLDHQRGLKDQRYKLINSSKDHLSIRISNVTTGDEGLYTCYQYGAAVITKQVNVTVLAAPSKPLLEESTVHGREEKMLLRCSTWGSKPPPQMTWLLDNGIELFGDTQHQCEGNGKKCNTTSTLAVHTFKEKSTVTCVIRHEALGRGNLTATVHLSRIKSTTDIIPTTSEFGMTTSDNPWHHTDNILNATEGNFWIQRRSPSSEADMPNSTTINGMSDSDIILNVTERNFGAQTISASKETATQKPNSINGTNFTHEGIVKKPSKLLPILVAGLLLILFVIVLLLSVKLWKAHRAWKRENDSSELTLESYKVRPNEDNRLQENRHAFSRNSSKKRATEGSCRTSSKNSEESNESVFEKQLPYIKETDL
ncbi:cytotoxic and regulatory T-cell molecule [Eublepharis macularius]|uniref:Cytotoxic and regulatory T-cell molecule n=1 Tax=Eublepharis macularius TaxID=481883 RepID=A0AA97KF07_EUBMA|nr:cytotoxic and regulatory T-cell molecule [Eublepharis macularius]